MTRALAHANIALAKYWGKSDVARNLPAVPSLSLTLEALSTHTSLVFDENLGADEIALNNAPAKEKDCQRISTFLSFLRTQFNEKRFAHVSSTNNFPTAAGLASSASGFAALVVAFNGALNLKLDAKKLSALARQGSASAARSIFGGFVALDAGQPGQADLAAKPLHPPHYWDLRVVIAITADSEKHLGSTEAMKLCRETSPYYNTWLEHAPRLYEEIKAAVAARDITKLGPALEQSSMAMHAAILSSKPAIIYWNAATLNVLTALSSARKTKGLEAYATMDAGPQVKVFCQAKDVQAVQSLLSQCSGVTRTIISGAGVDARVLE